jgi:endonuclease-3
MNLIGSINKYLDELFLNPVSELDYNKDYELLISVMLSAQTTDKRVNEVGKILYTKYPSLEDLKNADIEDIKNIIRPLGSFNKKASNVIEISKRLLEDKNGVVPCDRDYLESLPGVGRKTTNVVLGELFKVPCIAVDTHVERVSKRLNLANENDDVREVEEKLTKIYEGEEMIKKHHQLLLFGRYYCKAKNPLCEGCKLKEICTKKS